VTFYKVINGGHTWSGATPVPPLGNTNQDINQSAIIGSFFKSFCAASTGVNNGAIENSVNVYPNPFTERVTFTTSNSEQTTVVLYDYLSGQIVQQTFNNSITLNTKQLADGIYFYALRNLKGIITNGKVIKH